MATREEWRPVVGFEGWYEVSSRGRVKRIRPGRGVHSLAPLKPILRFDGRLRVGLWRHGKMHPKKVHCLVAEAFLGKRPPRHDVHHINGDFADNRLGNLEYTPRKQHRGQHHRGEGSVLAKLTWAQVRKIRALAHGGAMPSRLADRFGVARTTISGIIHYQRWPEEEAA